MDINIVACVILIFAYLACRTFKYKCPAPGCDFLTNDEDAAQKHAALHARHKPTLQEIY